MSDEQDRRCAVRCGSYRFSICDVRFLRHARFLRRARAATDRLDPCDVAVAVLVPEQVVELRSAACGRDGWEGMEGKNTRTQC